MGRKWVELRCVDGIDDGKCYSIVATPKMENWHFTIRNTGKGTKYTVLIDNNFERVSCDCPDFIYRRSKKGEYCKHIKMVFKDFGYMFKDVVEVRRRKELEEAKRQDLVSVSFLDMGNGRL